jgi:hypothetical protein
VSRRELLREFLNDPKEVHALFNGFYKSVMSLKQRPNLKDSQDEPHYWRLGWLLGDVAQVAIAVAGAKYGGLW